MEPELLDCILRHLVARHREHAELMGALKQDYLSQTIHSVEIERREPHWNEFADAVNRLTGLKHGGRR